MTKSTNHPVHGPVSVDRLHQIREHLQHDTQYSNGGNRAYILADVLKVIDGAISAFGAEPVAWRWFHLNQWHVTNDEERARDLSWDSVKVTPLYAAPPAPVVPTFDQWLAIRGDKPLGWVKDAMRESYDACRAAMLQAGNSPVTQDGYVLVPKKLTAENGAKRVLSGEFSETKFINCPECFGDDDCETCDGSGRIEITVPVTWTTIKAIWAKGVEHFAAAPQQENV
ncbi:MULTISPECIES: hypothetical protein [Citrobacter]|uniref:hypothetical protein n=1 Tax=Citrobacter TaxID=544 RepID=UPI000846F9D8|nr:MULTISPECIES: hypothetical protein [Citrobacter]MBQ4926701.1 hypothetical protein [Citrobacter werkmanii]MBQ4939057.1 hypothetical protein [Citrobacter werkmanii]MBQ4951878.1 hypothetical protein [Citrobacter werkmanii]MBQ4964693.1 hypothetical protein [Citrobacter werkmanii]MDM3297429.1 hypothetical protein [Citrobacter sp. Cc139]